MIVERVTLAAVIAELPRLMRSGYAIRVTVVRQYVRDRALEPSEIPFVRFLIRKAIQSWQAAQTN